MKRLFILGCCVVMLTTAAGAQNVPGDRVRHERIREGFRDGQLNRVERYRLHRNERRMRIAKRHAHHDGRVSPMERRRLHKMRVHQRREIYRFKHNNHRRII